MNAGIHNYFKDIEKKVAATYRVAEKARKKGFDPEGHLRIAFNPCGYIFPIRTIPKELILLLQNLAE